MADRYLLESGAGDGYQLEDASGVLLLEGPSQEEDSGWWGGIFMAGASLALASSLAASALSAQIARSVATSWNDEWPTPAATSYNTPPSSGAVYWPLTTYVPAPFRWDTGMDAVVPWALEEDGYRPPVIQGDTWLAVPVRDDGNFTLVKDDDPGYQPSTIGTAWGMAALGLADGGDDLPIAAPTPAFDDDGWITPVLWSVASVVPNLSDQDDLPIAAAPSLVSEEDGPPSLVWPVVAPAPIAQAQDEWPTPPPATPSEDYWINPVVPIAQYPVIPVGAEQDDLPIAAPATQLGNNVYRIGPVIWPQTWQVPAPFRWDGGWERPIPTPFAADEIFGFTPPIVWPVVVPAPIPSWQDEWVQFAPPVFEEYWTNPFRAPGPPLPVYLPWLTANQDELPIAAKPDEDYYDIVTPGLIALANSEMAIVWLVDASEALPPFLLDVDLVPPAPMPAVWTPPIGALLPWRFEAEEIAVEPPAVLADDEYQWRTPLVWPVEVPPLPGLEQDDLPIVQASALDFEAAWTAPTQWEILPPPTLFQSQDEWAFPAPADEVYWLNPVVPVADVFVRYVPWTGDEQHVPLSISVAEEYWQNLVAPVPLLYQPYWPWLGDQNEVPRTGTVAIGGIIRAGIARLTGQATTALAPAAAALRIKPRVYPVVDLLGVAGAGLPRVASVLESVLGKTVSLSPLILVHTSAGTTITNAAASPGTDLPEARSVIDFGDAGIDQVRLVVRGRNSAAGSVIVELYRVADNGTIASVTVTDAALDTFVGTWAVFKPTGQDEHVGLRVVGNGVFDPVLYRVEVQMRSLRKVT